MIPQFVVAGVLSLIGAVVHGGAGEALILRKLFAGELPSSRFGGPAATRVMVRFTWHAVTLTFAVLGTGLATCGFVGPVGTCRGVGIVAAIIFTAFVALTLVVVLQRPRTFFIHPGPPGFLVTAVLAWWGTV